MLPSLRFQESQIAGNEAALKTDIGQQVVPGYPADSEELPQQAEEKTK
jgi:hypothetical protein